MTLATVANAASSSARVGSGEHPAVKDYHATLAIVRTASNRALDECDARLDARNSGFEGDDHAIGQ